MTPSINKLFEEVVQSVSEQYGHNVSYLFGDWAYICGILTTWGMSGETAPYKYPTICLLSPFTEDRTEEDTEVSLEFILMVDTLKGYTNEQREEESFEKVLRPIYRLFMETLRKNSSVRYVKHIPHTYTENYRYGRLGVIGADGRPFSDFIDAIELKNVKLTIKNVKCYGNRY